MENSLSCNRRRRVPIVFTHSATYPEMAPDLVVEVLSPGNTLGEMNRKRLEYFDNGTRLMRIVDCTHRTVAVYKSTSDVEVLGGQDLIHGGTVVEGFEVSVQDFFADLDLQA